jgi:bacillolysin
LLIDRAHSTLSAMTSKAATGLVFVCLFAHAAVPVPAIAQGRGRSGRIVASSSQKIRQFDSLVDSLQRSGELRLRQHRPDALITGREHDRLDQYYKGVRVFGGDVARQMERGITVSLFGTVYDDIDIEVDPALSADGARTAIERAAGSAMPAGTVPELVVLPRDAGGYDLAYRARVFSDNGLFMYFVDARSGAPLLQFNDLKTEAAVGSGKGVLGDDKKLSVAKESATYRTSDGMRPPALKTFDLRGDATRAMNFLTGRAALLASDVATDTDNAWSDGAVVDAHAYAGWVYDFYFKRFGRRGLDNADIPITSIVHPARRDDVMRQSNSIVGLLYLNAAYFGDGIMVYGEGLPPAVTDGAGRHWNFMSGGLDVIAHELTHGVTDYSSRLIYRGESGALNEAFSDIMATAVEFSFQPKGDGLLRADYLIGEDVVTPGGLRSLQDPAAFGDPDHYTKRYRGPADNGGVHTNSTIATHAFYLAIEGGENQTSQLRVEGAGAANRQQIENVFYRAFVQLMPSDATYAVARAATIQSARDLYGEGSAVERAVTEAWSAVGVN